MQPATRKTSPPQRPKGIVKSSGDSGEPAHSIGTWTKETPTDVLRRPSERLFIASGAPHAESALLLGQKLPGASGGYIHPEHLVEHLRPFMQTLEDRVFAERELVQLRDGVPSIAEPRV